MKIDLHCHTLEVKKGDSGRNVNSSDFMNAILSAGVGIVAITNHNKFDIQQYNEFVNKAAGQFLIWPGVELDVEGCHSGSVQHGHVIVVCDPQEAVPFSSIVSSLCTGDLDKFVVNVDKLPSLFFSLGRCLFACHYHKSPDLASEDIGFLTNSVGNNGIVVLEPSSARRAGMVVLGDKKNSWFGSDVKDWHHYPSANPDFHLPESKFNITSFGAFLDLLSKNSNAAILETFLSPKKVQEFTISPFEDLNLSLSLYHDINIIFGGKATGKTQILNAIREYFAKQSKDVRFYSVESKPQDLQIIIQRKPSEQELNDFHQKDCSLEIKELSGWKWHDLPSPKDFLNYYQSIESATLASKLKIIGASFAETIDETNLKKQYKRYIDDITALKRMREVDVSDILSVEEKTNFGRLLQTISKGILSRYLNSYIETKSLALEKFTIDTLKPLISNSEGVLSKPNSCGLSLYWDDLKQLKNLLNTIRSNFSYSKQTHPEQVGVLQAKGPVERFLKIGFSSQPVSAHKNGRSSWLPRIFLDSTVTDQKCSDFKKELNSISFANSPEKIARQITCLQAYIIDNHVTSLFEFVNYSLFLKTATTADFMPSNGETSVLLVDNVLNDSKADVLLLDEPDSGMGSDFINGPLLTSVQKAANLNKIIVIATHDPNLVVRTHPYFCVYREEIQPAVYKTYCGSSFEDLMVNPQDSSDTKPWVDACVTKCEGGTTALTERERVYGYYDD
jgi:AAA15 family ATPase/GTPase